MPSSSVFGVQRTGMTEVKSYSKHWPCLFPQHGPGRKHGRPIVLEEWVPDTHVHWLTNTAPVAPSGDAVSGRL